MKFRIENVEEHHSDLSKYFPSSTSQVEDVRLKYTLAEVEEWV